MNNVNSLTQRVPYQTPSNFPLSLSSTQASSSSPPPVLPAMTPALSVATFDPSRVAAQLVDAGINSNFLIRMIGREFFSGESGKKNLSRMISQQFKAMISTHPQTELLAHKAAIVPALERLELRDLFEALLLKDSLGNPLSSATINELLPRTVSLDDVMEFLATTVPHYSLTDDEEDHYPTDDGEFDLTNMKAFEVIIFLIRRAVSSLQPITTPEERRALSLKICSLLKIRDQEGYPCCFTIDFELMRSLFSLLEFEELKEIMLTPVPRDEDEECFFEVITEKEIWMTILELDIFQESIVGPEVLQDYCVCVTNALSNINIPIVISQITSSYLSEILSDPLFELLTLRSDLTGDYLFHSLLCDIEDEDFKQITVLPLLRTPNILGDYVVHHCLRDSRGKPSVAPHQVVGKLMHGLKIHEALKVLQLKDNKNKSVIHHFPAESNWTVEPETPIVVQSANPHVRDESLQGFATFLLNLCNSIASDREVSSQQLAAFLNTTGMDPSGNTILGIIINYSHIDVSCEFEPLIIGILEKLETSDLDNTLNKLMELSHLQRPIDLQILFMNNERSAARVLKKVSKEIQERIFNAYPELQALLDKNFDAPMDIGTDADEGDDIPEAIG